jgi:hypothetical protein
MQYYNIIILYIILYMYHAMLYSAILDSYWIPTDSFRFWRTIYFYIHPRRQSSIGNRTTVRQKLYVFNIGSCVL